MATIWQKAFSRTFWKNRPNTGTPLGESKLLPMDASIDEIDNRVVTLQQTKAEQSDFLTSIKNIQFNRQTGVFTITKFNDTTFTIDTDLEKIAVNFDYDDDPASAHYQQIILTLIDGTVKYIDLSALITQYEFTDSATIDFSVGADGKISATVIDGSITESKLQPNYLGDIRVETAKSQQYMTNAQTAQNAAETAQGLAEDAQEAAETAQGLAETAQTGAEDARDRASASATSAITSETNALASATQAGTYASNASTSASNASTSESNASAYATNAYNSASSAGQSATSALDSAEDSEAWAVGKRNGVPVESADETYENNAKYYASQAAGYRDNYVGTCTGQGANQIKVVTISSEQNFTLHKGAGIAVKFDANNTYSATDKNPVKLNVNNTGAKQIYGANTATPTGTNTTFFGRENYINYYMYDGTYWVWAGSSADNNTTYTPQALGIGYGTCTTAAAITAKVATLSGYSLVTNGIVSVKFTNSVPANATLNINNKGAKNIYYQGAKIVAGVIKAGNIATFVYSGNYNLICIDHGSKATDISYDNNTNVKQAIDSKQDTLTFDNTPTANSNNPVKSSGIKEAFDGVYIFIPITVENWAAWKNGAGNRGKDITSYWKDGSLADRIDGVNGFKHFEDLYLWDYIDLDSNITAPSSGGGSVTGTKRIHIGEFNGLNNYQLNKRYDNVNFFNHLRMVTGTHFGMSKMNDTNTTEGGYIGSKMHTDIIGNISTSGTLAKQLYDQLGSLLVPTTELLTNSINASGYNRFGANSGCSNNWTWADVYARLLSELESNGSIVWSSSGYDTGNAQHQLPAFKNDKAAAYPQGIYYWLKDIATSTGFCRSGGGHGGADYGGASNVNYVRLLLTIGHKPS